MVKEGKVTVKSLKELQMRTYNKQIGQRNDVGYHCLLNNESEDEEEDVEDMEDLSEH